MGFVAGGGLSWMIVPQTFSVGLEGLYYWFDEEETLFDDTYDARNRRSDGQRQGFDRQRMGCPAARRPSTSSALDKARLPARLPRQPRLFCPCHPAARA
jgi:hypothetical protein